MPPSSTRAIEPPPAPIVWMSIIGSAMRHRSTMPSVITSGWPSLTSAASKLVPPMSIVMQSRTPCGASCQRPAVGPEAGPERSESAARSATSAGAATPPFDCMISSTPSKSRSASRAVSASRYRVMIGPTYAFSTVVEVRS